MEIIDVLFYLFTFAILFCAVMTVTLKHVLHAAISLMGCLLATGGLFLLMHAELVALMQIMVYIGGVVIFIVYAILLTTDLGDKFLIISPTKRVLAAMFSLILAVIVSYIMMYKLHLVSDPIVPNLDNPTAQEKIPDIAAIGERLLQSGATGFLIPFEVISIVLLTALIAASTIARKSGQEKQRDLDKSEGLPS